MLHLVYLICKMFPLLRDVTVEVFRVWALGVRDRHGELVYMWHMRLGK